MASSMSGLEAIVVENGLLARVNASRRSINKYVLFGRVSEERVFLLVWKHRQVEDTREVQRVCRGTVLCSQSEPPLE